MHERVGQRPAARLAARVAQRDTRQGRRGLDRVRRLRPDDPRVERGGRRDDLEDRPGRLRGRYGEAGERTHRAVARPDDGHAAEPVAERRGGRARQRRIDRRAHRAAPAGARARDHPLAEQQPSGRVAGQAVVVHALHSAGQGRQVEPRAVGGQHRSTPRCPARLPDHRLVPAQPWQSHREVPADARVVPTPGDGQHDRPAQGAEDVGLDRDRHGDPAVALRPEPADPDLAHAGLAVGVAVGGHEPALGRGLAGAHGQLTPHRGVIAARPGGGEALRRLVPGVAGLGLRAPRVGAAGDRRQDGQRDQPAADARPPPGAPGRAVEEHGSRPGTGRGVAGATAGHPLVLAGRHHISSGVVSCFQ